MILSIRGDTCYQWRNAWTLHVEGFHEINLNEKIVTKLKEDVRKLVVIAVVSSFR